MAIKENELTELSNIAVNDKVRMVTSGGASANGSVTTLADTILTQSEHSFLDDTYTVGEAFAKLNDNAFMGQGYGSCSTAAATTAKTASVTNYRDTAGGIVTIRFQYAVPADATLNISNTGAYPIYYKNASITAGIINAGDTCTFMYDGSHYVLISKDSPYSIESATPSISNITTGSIVNSSVKRCGKFRHIRLAVKNSAAVNAGANVFAGTLTKDIPAELVNAAGYFGSTAGILQIAATGAVSVRVIGGTLAADSMIYVGCMYMCNE